jgi:hypothetical protein
MGRPSKPMAKNSNSRFTTRNNKQEIFSRIAKISKPKNEIKTQEVDDNKPDTVEEKSK